MLVHWLIILSGLSIGLISLITGYVRVRKDNIRKEKQLNGALYWYNEMIKEVETDVTTKRVKG